MDTRENIIKKVNDYKNLVVQSKLLNNISQVYLFGSYAKGKQNDNSDIDVAFVVNDFNGDFFKIFTPIYRLTEKVDLRIEPHIIVPNEDYAGFYDEIKTTGILI